MPKPTTTAWKRLASAALLLTAAAEAGWAQTSVPEATTTGEDQGSNVTSYRPDFFARFRPNTAMDMINRIPAFSFDGGSGGRGFSGTGGNVLIDGAISVR